MKRHNRNAAALAELRAMYAPKPVVPCNIGDRVFYRGDMANPQGWVRLVEVVPAGRFAPMQYVFEFEPEYRDCGEWQRDRTTVYATMLADVDTGDGMTRFVTEAAWLARREAQKAQWEATMKRLQGAA